MEPRIDVPDGLLDDVKAFLGVTWEDPQTDKRYSEMILSGMAYLDDKYGVQADYTVPGEPRTLLFEYVRYDRDSALDVFENNYRNRILGMQNGRRLGAYVEGTVQTSAE